MRITIRSGDGPDALDRALRLARKPEDVIDAKGTLNLTTQGAWAFPEFGYRSIGRCRIDLGNSRVTLSPEAATHTGGVPRPDRDFWIAWTDPGARVYGGVWNCNEVAFRDPDPTRCWFTRGIRFGGGAYKAHGVNVVGMRGTYANRGSGILNPDVEAFGISSGGQPDVRHEIVDCEVSGCAPDSYCSGIMSGGDHPIPVDQIPEGCKRLGLISNCRVDLGGLNWFAFSSNVACEDPYIGLAVEIRDGLGAGVERGFHNDTGPTAAVLRRMSFRSTWSDISLAGGDTSTRRVVLVDRCLLGADCAVDIAGAVGSQSVIIQNSSMLGTRAGSVSGSGQIVVDRKSLLGKAPKWQVFGSAPLPIVLP